MLAILKKVKKSIPEIIRAEELYDKSQSSSEAGDCSSKQSDRVSDNMEQDQLSPRHHEDKFKLDESSMDCDDEDSSVACNR